jgi:predicted nucleotidyltransferase
METQEQLQRIVTKIGNGAHIFAPKEWINEKVLIIRLEKKNIKEQILEKIYPHLEKVIAVFLYGSHAREEATASSDVDVLIIAKEKFSIEKEQGQDFLVIKEDKISEAIKTNPILMYSIIKEAKSIINKDYLDKLKLTKINKNDFKEFIKKTKESINSNKEIIELDKKTGKYSSSSVIYSAILRLRGIFIIKCLIDDSEFSNSKFKKWLNPIKIDYEEIYEIYRRVRDTDYNEETKTAIEQEERLVNFLEKNLKELEVEIK